MVLDLEWSLESIKIFKRILLKTKPHFHPFTNTFQVLINFVIMLLKPLCQASLFYSSLSKSSNTVNKLLTEDITRQIGQTKKHFMNNKKRL